MKKSHLMLCVALALPAIAQINVAHAAISVDVNTPGGSIHIGDRDSRGNYWDGYDWRSQQWWRQHHNKPTGERNNRGLYWHGDRWEAAPPPKHNDRKPQPPRHAEPNHRQGDSPSEGNGQHGPEGHAPIPPTGGQHN